MNVEHFLARLLTEEDLEEIIRNATPEEAAVLATIDMESLRLARRSFARKRANRGPRTNTSST